MKTIASRFSPRLFERLTQILSKLVQPTRQPARQPVSLPAMLLPVLLLATVAPIAQAAAATPRIAAEINSSQMSALPNSKNPHALAQNDTGRLAGSTKLQGISLYFSRTKAQEADLQTLLAAQQTPGSAQYHQWLTPEQFGARFGLADADIAKIQTWLEQQGFSVDSVARGKTMIRFSGTVAQVESAFATEVHSYSVKTTAGTTETHYATATALSVPSAMASVVLGVRNLDDFRPRAKITARRNRQVKPSFTSSESGSVFFAPGDIATVYDIQKAYNAGYTGSGQSIAIVGQSAIYTSDIEAFQTAAGLTVKDPTQILVAGSGDSTVNADGDETESDLDLEWSGAIAKGADIYFVYTGSNTNQSAFDSIQYAVDNKIANIISSSYGDCETDLGTYTLESTFEQAAAQGQTILSASGDDGSTDCYEDTNLTTAQREALAVDYPASSPYVTGVGGTEISQANADYLTAGDGYWTAQGSADEITSALQYIPEQAWNEDDAQYGLSSGGGGASALFAKPTWQTGVPGIPADSKRDVPDVALYAAPDYPGYLFCSSDTTDWSSGQVASCNSGFRDSSTGDLTIAGGTSFAAPIFAGMVAIINQQQNYTTGQGLINPTLYSLASNSTTYASAFHDITTGNNECTAGSTFCNGTIGFAAGTGYDQATGLGSVDFNNLVTGWPANTGAALLTTTTTVSASNTAPAINTNDTFTVTVAPQTGTGVPTGTVTITVDGGTPITGNTLTANGTFTYTTSFTTAGTHTVLATYSGDSTYAASTGSVSVTVAVTSSGTGTIAFTPAPTNVTVTSGSTGSSTISITPAGGYTGTVVVSLTGTSNNSALENLCYGFGSGEASQGSIVISGTAAATTTLSLDTNALDCATEAVSAQTGKHRLSALFKTKASNAMPKSAAPINGLLPQGKSAPIGIAFAGLMLAGFLGRKARRFRSLLGVIALVTIGLAVSACGGNNNNTISNPSKGTYTIDLSASDASNASIPTVTSTFTLTIQ
jgi:subtilase family serine protease